MLYLPLGTPPRAVFPVHTRGSALTHTYIIRTYIYLFIVFCLGGSKGKSVLYFPLSTVKV